MDDLRTERRLMPLSPYGAGVYRDRILAVLDQHRLLEPAAQMLL